MSTATPRLHRLGRLDIATETSFAQTAGAYTYLEHVGAIDLTGLERRALIDEAARPNITQYARVPGPRTGQIVTKHYLHGFSATLPVAAPTATSHPLGHILAMALGTSTVGGYVSQDPTGSTTADLRGADLTSFKIGQAVAYSTPTRTGYHTAWATNNVAGATDILTFLQTAPEAASTNPTVAYGSLVCAQTSGHTWYSAGVREAFRLRYTSQDGEEEYTMVGAVPIGVKCRIPRGELPTVEITWGVAGWSYAAAVTAPVPGTYAYADPEFVGGTWIAWGAGGATPTRVNNLEIDFGIVGVPHPNPNYTNGISGWAYTNRQAKATFSVYRDGSASLEVDDYDDQTGRAFSVTIGSQPGKLVAFVMPNARIIEYPKRADEDGLLISQVTLEAQEYTGDTADAGSNVEDSDFRIAFL